MIDIASSTQHFSERFDGSINGLNDVKHDWNDQTSRIMPRVGADNYAATGASFNCERPLLICRGHLPGYLLSSSIYAVGVLISEPRQPVWEPRTHPALMTSFMPDTTLWHDLVQGFFESSNNEIVEARGYEAHSSGLILALEGPRIVTISMANRKYIPCGHWPPKT